jgi:hypothetical protein
VGVPHTFLSLRFDWLEKAKVSGWRKWQRVNVEVSVWVFSKAKCVV